MTDESQQRGSWEHLVSLRFPELMVWWALSNPCRCNFPALPYSDWLCGLELEIRETLPCSNCVCSESFVTAAEAKLEPWEGKQTGCWLWLNPQQFCLGAATLGDGFQVTKANSDDRVPLSVTPQLPTTPRRKTHFESLLSLILLPSMANRKRRPQI